MWAYHQDLDRYEDPAYLRSYLVESTVGLCQNDGDYFEKSC